MANCTLSGIIVATALVVVAGGIVEFPVEFPVEAAAASAAGGSSFS